MTRTRQFNSHFFFFFFILKKKFTVTDRDATITAMPTQSGGFVKSSGGVIGNVNFFQEPAGIHYQNPGHLCSCSQRKGK
jgi:hypothetical protein